MTTRDYRFLLLTGKLGDSKRNPLTSAQLRMLTHRMELLAKPNSNDELTLSHLNALGLPQELSARVLKLLEDEAQLEAYLRKGKKNGCFPITRSSGEYPLIVRKRLGQEAPGCLWLQGNPDIMNKPTVSLVGSRDLNAANGAFAREVGKQAAVQGFVLVSGNARGSDRAAQKACIDAGGSVISVVADELCNHAPHERILYVSEENFDEPFSSVRALHRNKVIHAWGEITFVAQCSLERGGTWNGSIQNLHHRWSPLFCFSDNSPAVAALEGKGATLIHFQDLVSFQALSENQISFL